ncbi:hypothetical protein D5R40_24940 [Okeania hirsuta]|uniref:Uncharacterized protein n=1 Tax=Okeania hirsuta TaxID=1458930 RepID=A0A3N6RGK4_9CYAN|nr:hypothetical protein D4Z78_02595 [Okeania hirsuta]RQH29195.1 hypothetical protein D5R40_24940 [Okeania hirsuta]
MLELFDVCLIIYTKFIRRSKGSCLVSIQQSAISYQQLILGKVKAIEKLSLNNKVTAMSPLSKFEK